MAETTRDRGQEQRVAVCPGAASGCGTDVVGGRGVNERKAVNQGAGGRGEGRGLVSGSQQPPGIQEGCGVITPASAFRRRRF